MGGSFWSVGHVLEAGETRSPPLARKILPSSSCATKPTLAPAQRARFRQGERSDRQHLPTCLRTSCCDEKKWLVRSRLFGITKRNAFTPKQARVIALKRSLGGIKLTKLVQNDLTRWLSVALAFFLQTKKAMNYNQL